MDKLDRLTTLSLDRRELLRLGTLGAGLVGLGGLAPLAEAVLQTTARNEREFRTRLLALGTLSLKSANLGLKKATNPALKTFAGFEHAEQTAIGKVLKEMGTPAPPMDAEAMAVVRKHEQAEGAAFDKIFAQAQLDTHLKLKALNEDFLKNSKGNGVKEMHARHLATVALAAIGEHIAHTKAYVAMLGAQGE